MSNNIKIYYNNKDIFKDIAPTPLVSISHDYIDFGNKFNQVTNLTLEGQITGNPYPCNFNSLFDISRSLVNDLKDNYKPLRIVEDGSTLYQTDIAIVNSINFPEDAWYGVLPFDIEFSIYDTNFFQESYGVVDPEENFSFDESEGDILTLTQSLSAQGIKTSTASAIENAKAWVSTRVSQIDKIKPILCKNNTNNFLLQTVSEEIDRFNGKYNYTAVYKKGINPENPSNCFLKYSIDVNSGFNDGLVQSTINGSLNGNTINILRSAYNNLNLFGLCNSLTFDTFKVNLNNKPTNNSVEESPNENSLNFNATYDTNNLPEIVNDYTVSVNYDPIKCISEGSISAKIFGTKGDVETKWPKVKQYYESQFSPYSLMIEEYRKDAIISAKPLNETPVSESISFNEYNAEITYNASYNNKTNNLNKDIISMSSSVSFKPSLDIHVSNPAADVPREHNVQNLQCISRASCQASVTVVAKMNKDVDFAKSEAEKEINRIKGLYVIGGNSLEEEYTVSTTELLRSATINATWSFEGTKVT